MNIKVENQIENQYRNLRNNISEEFIELYKDIMHPKLKIIFSTLQYKFIELFKMMNTRLPVISEYGIHFWAEPSRELLAVIEITKELQSVLNNTSHAFKVDQYYDGIIHKCTEFLSRSSGSTIPLGMNKIELYYTIPIFIQKNTITIKSSGNYKTFNLKLIGEGSYAKAFRYRDEYYKKNFVLKRAKKDLSEKELHRFKLEFDQMNNLNSPYIVEVYSYNHETNEYIMEYMDYTLDDYINKNNSKLSIDQRKKIVLQILKAFSYIHSKELLHRDISPKNILIKNYDDTIVVKIADFGLVKMPVSSITSVNTEFKGYFNDPSLIVEGFNNYNVLHETYSLTRLIFFVMTGRINLGNITDLRLKKFVEKGLSTDKSERYKNVNELLKAFRDVYR